jgi:hypothetical protein
MKERREIQDPIAELERLDAFLDGSEPGQRPIDALAARGVDVPDEATLDDSALHERLWIVIHAMAEIGMVLDSTDHLSDRELYRWLATDVLVEETFLSDDVNGAWHMSPIGGFSEEDIAIYLRYYADDADRRTMGNIDTLPPREKRPYDRDRFLPQFGSVNAEA